MRFVSQYLGFIKTAIKPHKMIIQSERGPVFHEDGGIICEFASGGLLDHEIKEALKVFNFKGLGPDSNPVARLSVYDTDEAAVQHGWTKAIKDQVEEALVRSQGATYLLIEPIQVPAPWKAYDKLLANKATPIEAVAEKIVEMTVETGSAPQDVLDYELQNLARPTIVKALEEHIASLDEVEEEVIVA